jgi:uncharacterized linocin/CFP29 family protein
LTTCSSVPAGPGSWPKLTEHQYPISRKPTEKPNSQKSTNNNTTRRAKLLMNEIKWTDDQWKMMATEVSNELENSRLAQKIIKKMILPPEARSVSRDRFDYATGTVDETYDPIADSDEPVLLTKEQTEDADLGRAKLIVRRAAQRLARDHDQQVFVQAIRNAINAGPQGAGNPYQQTIPVNPPNGDGLVTAVASALAALEADGYRTGFVMVAGQNVYSTMHLRVPGAADLPRKAIEGLLENGPIHRSSVLAPDEALILSLSGEEIDRAVAIEPILDFRRVAANDTRELRLYERFLTRFKQTRAVVLIQMPAQQQGGQAPQQGGGQQQGQGRQRNQ